MHAIVNVATKLTLLVAVSFVSPVQVHAQRADSTDAGWAEFALGYGALHAFSGTSGGGRHMDGYSFLFGGGITRSHLCAGVLLDIWQHRFPDGETETANIALTASTLYYLSGRGGLFFEGGLGLSDYRMLKGLHGGLLFESTDTTYFKGFGLTGTLGIGRDVQVGWLVLTPRMAYLYGTTHAALAERNDGGDGFDAAYAGGEHCGRSYPARREVND